MDDVRNSVVARFRTVGGSTAIVIRHAGRWRRYTWRCLGCGAPPERARRRLARRVARRRAWRHANTCRRPT